MATSDASNTRTGSTTWEWQTRRVRAVARQGQQGVRKAGRFRGLQRRDSKSRLTLTIAYKGGTEAWYVVEARGRVVPFTGVTALHDMMREINQDY